MRKYPVYSEMLTITEASMKYGCSEKYLEEERGKGFSIQTAIYKFSEVKILSLEVLASKALFAGGNDKS